MDRKMCGTVLHTHSCVINCEKFSHPATEPHTFSWFDWERPDPWEPREPDYE